MNKALAFIFLLSVAFGCKGKKKTESDPQQFFPVISYLKGQAAEVDSSVTGILKIEKNLNGKADTNFIDRDEFRRHANEFLSLPEISSDQLRDDYEVTSMHDDLLNAYVFTYTSKEEEHEIQKQDVIVVPAEDGTNKINAVSIDRWQQRGDSLIHKNMLWEAGKRFYIVTKSSKKGQPEVIKTLEIKWNNYPPGYEQ